MKIAAFILLLFIVLFALYYVFQSGALKELKSSFSFRFPTPPPAVPESHGTEGVAATSTLSDILSAIRGTSSLDSYLYSGSATSGEARIYPHEIPKGFTAAELSPHFKKIRIGSVSPGYFGSYGSISLYAYPNAGEKIAVTDWRLQANRGSHFIPQAVEVYDPSGLAAERVIELGSGDVLYVYSTASPIRRNLRINKCMGYLENVHTFEPALYRSCPYVSRSNISHFTGRCQDYILSLGSCKFPDSNPPVPRDDYACREYLNTLNYRGCFDRYRNDQDFILKEVRVWISSWFLDQSHDRVLLFDRQGLLVDEYGY